MNIKCPLTEIRIVDFAQSLRVSIRDFGEDELDVELVPLKCAKHFVDQCSVFDNQQMSVENTGILCADRFSNTLLHLENLCASGDERAFESDDLVRNIGCVNSPLWRFFVVGMVNKNNPAGYPWAYAESLKSYFLTAHSGLIPRRTVFRSVVRVPA